MASAIHGPYTVVSRPARLGENALWIPFSVVMWKDEQGFHCREFTTEKTFRKEDEAIDFGLTSARAWIMNQAWPARNNYTVAESDPCFQRRRAADKRQENPPR